MANKSVEVLLQSTILKNRDELEIPFPKSMWGPKVASNFVYICVKLKIINCSLFSIDSLFDFSI